MLREGFQKIFWGFIIVLIEIHIIAIDILPDPIGYYLIFSGLSLLEQRFVSIEKAKSLALGLSLFSIPTVFLQNNAVNELGAGSIFSGWGIYLNLVGILNLVLVYYIFRFMLSIVELYSDRHLQSRTEKTFKVYMISMLIITFSQSFAMNMSMDLLMVYTIVSVAVSLIMHVIFLVLVNRFSKLPEPLKDEEKASMENLEADNPETKN